MQNTTAPIFPDVNGKKMAVIILNWNGEKLLQRFIPPVFATTVSERVDLIVADNGSTDGSLAWLRGSYPDVKILEFPENYGYAGGYNKALEETRYPYTVLLNSDVETTPGWAETMLDFLTEHPEAGAVQPKILQVKERNRFEYAGAAGGLLDRYGYPYCRGRLFESIETDRGQYDDGVADIAWASGAAMGVNTALYLQLGGLDRDFFAHMEEIDLCCRMIAAGYRVCALSGASVHHLGGGTLPQGNSRKVYLNFRNNLLLLHKNLPKGRRGRILFVRRLADTLAWAKFMVAGDTANARAILRAHRDFRKMRRNYTATVTDNYMRHIPGADRYVVIERYLLGRKS